MAKHSTSGDTLIMQELALVYINTLTEPEN